MTDLIHMEGIVKSYTLGDQDIQVLRGVSLSIKQGDFIAIMGQSGSGKSTLMNIVGLLDTPTSGEYLLEGKPVGNLDEDELTHIRRKKIGFVFQQYNLLPRMSAIKQVMLPLMYQGIPADEREKKSWEALKTVGLEDRAHNKPNELSGGQQQRVSIARALVSDPEIILADEPTGALDSKTGKELLELFDKLNKEGKTIILITHEQSIANYAKKTIHIADGLIINSPDAQH